MDSLTAPLSYSFLPKQLPLAPWCANGFLLLGAAPPPGTPPPSPDGLEGPVLTAQGLSRPFLGQPPGFCYLNGPLVAWPSLRKELSRVLRDHPWRSSLGGDKHHALTFIRPLMLDRGA